MCPSLSIVSGLQAGARAHPTWRGGSIPEARGNLPWPTNGAGSHGAAKGLPLLSAGRVHGWDGREAHAMWVEMVVGILVISFLVFLMGPVFWSSRMSLRDKN